MKLIISCLILFFSITISIAQKPLDLNQGQPQQKDFIMTMPYKDVNGKIVIQVSLNNSPYKFIVDTGAPTAISEEIFNAIKTQPLGTIPMSDQSGAIDSIRVVSVERITINEITFEKTPAIVAKEPQILFQCYGVQGIIGSNLLRNTTIQFNAKEKQLILTDSPKKLKLKKKYASDMVLTPSQSNPFLKIYLRNTKTYVNEQVLFDTGDNDLYTLSNAVYTNVPEDMILFNKLYHGEGSFTMGFHGTAEKQTHLVIGVPQIEVNGSPFKNIVTKTTYSETSRVGSDILNYGIVTLDYPNKIFYFEPNSKEGVDVSKKIWPLDPILKDQKMVVGIIWDPSLVDKINIGDEILKFDTLDFQNMELCQIVLGNNKLDKEKAILILRDTKTGEEKTVEINKI